MEGVLITWRELLVGLMSVAVFFALQSLFLFIRRRQVGSESVSFPSDQELSSLRNELAAIRMRMDAIESQLESPRMPVPQTAGPPEPYDAEFAQSPHGQAMLLARDGLDANELSRRCGISVSEASLIVAMQRQKQTTS